MNAEPGSVVLPGAGIGSRSLTIVVPGLNEEELIRQTVVEIMEAGALHLGDGIELILVNDGSRDRTGAIMDELAAAYPGTRVVHNPTPQGLSAAFRDGIANARYPNFTLLPGDRAFEPAGLARLFSQVGSADLVVSWRSNQGKARSVVRLVLNRVYKLVMSTLFGLRLIDVHSVNIYPVAVVRSLDLHAEGIAFQIECLVKLLRRGISVVEVPVELTPERQIRSHALSWRALRNLAKTVLHLLVNR